jgi:hypothetical protein
MESGQSSRQRSAYKRSQSEKTELKQLLSKPAMLIALTIVTLQRADKTKKSPGQIQHRHHLSSHKNPVEALDYFKLAPNKTR